MWKSGIDARGSSLLPVCSSLAGTGAGDLCQVPSQGQEKLKATDWFLLSSNRFSQVSQKVSVRFLISLGLHFLTAKPTWGEPSHFCLGSAWGSHPACGNGSPLPIPVQHDGGRISPGPQGFCAGLSQEQRFSLAAASAVLVPAGANPKHCKCSSKYRPGQKLALAPRLNVPLARQDGGTSRGKLLLCPNLSEERGKSILWLGTEGSSMSLVSPGWHHLWHESKAETLHSSVKGAKASSEAPLRAGSLAHSSFPPSAVNHLPQLC